MLATTTDLQPVLQKCDAMLDLSSFQIGIIGLVFILIFVLARMPVGLALMIVSFLGLSAVRGTNVANGFLRVEPFDFAAHWSLSAIPMFLLMGAVAHHSGISSSLFVAARLWLQKLPGGLAVATNFACAGFATASGSSLATAAAMGRIALPEMEKAGYDKGLSTGVVASAGTLGAMIPPSILMVIYGIFAEVSISQLFIAGIVPGVLTAILYGAMIVLRCWINPSLAPRSEFKASSQEKYAAIADVWPIMILVLVIIVGLYAGIFTPTEAGAFGSLAAIAITAIRGRLSLKMLRLSVVEAMMGTARIFFIAVGAILFTRFLAFTGLTAYAASLVDVIGASPLILMLMTAVIYIVLGMFLDALGLMLLTLPILLPMYMAADINLIWFGIFVVKFVEIGLLTPPVGLNVYVVQSIAAKDVSLETVFKGVAWFLVCEAIMVALMIAYPETVLFLPNLMK